MRIIKKDMELYDKNTGKLEDTISLFTYLMSLLLIIVTIPITFSLVVFFSILVILESRGNAFYTQNRLGKNHKEFQIYKIRSMYTDAEKHGPVWATNNDNRVTKVGKFIRKTRIDELPQLINVIKGDMALVGPRPERPEFTKEFEKKIQGFGRRLAVKPGLTGWAQVNGGYNLTPLEKLKFDMEYIENKSILFDAKILLLTIKIVINGNGAR